MEKLNYERGTIVRLENTKHVGIVFDQYNTVELIAHPDEETLELKCRIINIDLRKVNTHPVTGKPFSYEKDFYGINFTQSELVDRIKKIRSQYEGTDYNKILNNCQHFAYELVTGNRMSPDADPWKRLGAFHKTLSKIEKITNGDSCFSATSSIGLQGFQKDFAQLIS